jgi:phosphonate metabolism transcriptional regulator PhnF
MQKSSGQTRYQQISNIIEEQIASGIYSPGAQLPTEQELSRNFQVNRHTVHEAIKELKREGLVFGVRGKGNFVSSDKIIYRLSNKVQFSHNMLEANLNPGAKLLQSRQIEADPELAEKLAMEPKAPLLALEILRSVNDVPFSLAVSYLPAERFGGLKELISGSFSLYNLLRQHYQVEPSRQESLFEVGMPDVREMQLLQISARNPLLVVRSLSHDQNRQPVEYVVSRMRGDMGCLAINFNDFESAAPDRS